MSGSWRGRRLTRAGAVHEARVAWSSANGLGLCYFVTHHGDGPAEDDRADRRAVLEPGEDLDAATERRLGELFDTGVLLTDSERRFEEPDGSSWLAQSVGPVWAEGVAAGLTGVLFTSLSGTAERWLTAAGPIRSCTVSELQQLQDRARGESAD